MQIETNLYRALLSVNEMELPSGVSTSGTKFENYTVQHLYQHLERRQAYKLFPPRYTLREPTYSGVAHQFDIVLRHDQLVTIECKFRSATGIADLFAFVGKLVDYRQPPAAIFVTNARAINDEVLCYAIAHQVSLIFQALPPVGFMMAYAKHNTDLGAQLAQLANRFSGDVSPKTLLVEWRHAFQRFKAAGYNEITA